MGGVHGRSGGRSDTLDIGTMKWPVLSWRETFAIRHFGWYSLHEAIERGVKMTTPVIWHFIKFFEKESYADQFMTGGLYLNTLAYFKEMESASCDGRMDSTEAVAMWWQPDDFVMNLRVSGIGDTEITKNDLVGPVSVSSDHHNNLNLFCLYALQPIGVECLQGKVDHALANDGEKGLQPRIDGRCFKFGKFAVIVHAVPFLNQLREALKGKGYKVIGKMVEYYDDEVFHGEIPMADIPFRKQKRFSYQREFRLCVDTCSQHDSPITIQIGDLSHISVKVDSGQLSRYFELTTQPVRSASRSIVSGLDPDSGAI